MRASKAGSRNAVRFSRVGFALIEVVVALALGGVVLLGARMLLGELADGERRMAESAAVVEADANGERLLRTLLGRLDMGASDQLRFGGTPNLVRFSSWCDVPSGWLERCGVELTIEAKGDSGALVVRFNDGSEIPLRRGFRSGTLRYLNTPANGGEWFRSWGTGVTAPLALGIILDGDTLIVRIGERS